MSSDKINDLIKTWWPVIVAVFMLYTTFVQIQSTVNELKIVTNKLDDIVSDLNVKVIVHDETLRQHELRLTKLEKN